MECREHDEIPESFLNIKAGIVGSCNGLICLSNSFPMKEDNNISVITFLIWNPTIKKIVELPPRTYCSRTQEPNYFGFGFDSRTNDYKVLCIVSYLGEEITNVCEIFDLGKGVWRVINPKVDSSWRVGNPNPKCYLNGVVHWDGYHNADKIILSFDMIDELFRVIRMPSGANRTGEIVSHVVTFKGLIYVIWVDHRHIDRTETCSVWAMKEYGVTDSWIKVFDINRNIAQGSQNAGIPLDRFRLWSDNEVFMVHDLFDYDNDNDNDNDNEEEVEGKIDLVVYNVKSKKLKYLCSTTKSIHNPCFYEESLVLMHVGEKLDN